MRGVAIAAGLLLLAASSGCGSSSAPYRSGDGVVESISCGAPGDCAAGGSYHRRLYNEAFVVSETKGKWGIPIKVPNTGTLSGGGGSRVLSVSCAAAGDCAAGGYYSYYTGSGRLAAGLRFYHRQAFVVTERDGSWGNAIEVPGTADLNSGWHAEVNSISCAAPGDCAAGGYYRDSHGRYQGFVVDETNGRWGKAIKVANTTVPRGYVVFDIPGVDSISCAAPGECAAGGYYYDREDNLRDFVVSETNGSWGDAMQVPGTAAHPRYSGPDAAVLSVSCAAAGQCAAGGYYAGQAFLVSQTNGTWGTAIKVPDTAKLNTGDNAKVDSISCVAAGECTAGGSYERVYYLDKQHLLTNPSFQTFVVTETNGTWGNAIQVPGTGALIRDNDGVVDSVSCVAAGECAAAGFYSDHHSRRQPFVVSETKSSWGTAIDVPGMAKTLDVGDGLPISISCAAAGECAAGGDAGYHSEAFVVSEWNGRWRTAIQFRSFPGS